MDGISKPVYDYFNNSYLYYIAYEDCYMTDGQYDALCMDLLKNWNKLSEFEQSILDPDLLSAGSGYSIPMETYRKLGIAS